MALDEPQNEDSIYEKDGITFMIDKELLEKVRPVKVDFIETARGSGYNITSSMSSCDSGGCGGGSCSC